jgi:hypothetical protein
MEKLQERVKNRAFKEREREQPRLNLILQGIKELKNSIE